MVQKIVGGRVFSMEIAEIYVFLLKSTKFRKRKVTAGTKKMAMTKQRKK